MARIKSSKDTRYGSDSIVTNDGAKLTCWALTNHHSSKCLELMLVCVLLFILREIQCENALEWAIQCWVEQI